MYNTQVRIAIVGVGGRVGRKLVQASLQDDMIVLSTAIEHKNSLLLGDDVGQLVGLKTKVIIKSLLDIKKDDFDVLIDFSCPEGTLECLKFCRKYGKPMVIGTTGFSDADKKEIYKASKDIAIVFSANFSIGINLIFKILEKVTKIIGNHSDIEIIESHHRNKVDAPSGTALAIGEIISKILDKNLEECAIYSRKGYIGKRISGTIGFSTIRAGNIIGEHTVIFSCIGEQIEIIHKASSRMTFAKGALKAANWIKEKKQGLFNMQDVLNINNL